VGEDKLLYSSVLLNKSPSGSNVSPYFEVQLAGGNYTWVGTGGANAKTIGAITTGTWQFLTYVRKSGVGYAYLNASLNESEADTNNYTHSNADVLRVGLRTDNYGPYDGSLALLRISATAPTAAQIAKIYNDEKYLFQDGAQATLYGASDAVTALAYDDATDLLHVGTSGGRSVFQGLRRVDNTTTAVGTAISASNNLVARIKRMTVYTTKPAINLREELASLRNQGGYSEQQFYFDGLVTNGTFDTDTIGLRVLAGRLVGGWLRTLEVLQVRFLPLQPRR
jgi:hypothetical protein